MVKGAKGRVEEIFGRQLRAQRLASSLSQEELAFRAGLDRTFISLLERGQRMPSLVTIIALANALTTTAADLVREIEADL